MRIRFQIRQKEKKMSSHFEVSNRLIGSGNPTFLIAELGINHNGDSDIAHTMIDAAADAGADAVKFQTYLTDDLVAEGNPYREIFKQAEISDLQRLTELQRHATKRGVVFFSSATTNAGLDILEQLDVPLYKLSSANLTNAPLLRRLGAAGKPLIISTGAATLSEVLGAAELALKSGLRDLAILKCTSIYPCPPELVNLNGMLTLRATFDGPIGFSDHTIGSVAPISAVAMGATIIEKHFTLDKTMEGHDHHFSADPSEFRHMVEAIRSVERMFGSQTITPVGNEIEFRNIGRRYVTAIDDIAVGQTIETAMIRLKRPKDGAGVPPDQFDLVVGRTARRNIEEGNSVKWADI